MSGRWSLLGMGCVGLALLGGVARTWAADTAAPTLRYGFQADRQYGYEINFRVTAQGTDRESSGVLVYKVLSATDQQVVLKPSGNAAAKLGAAFAQGFGPRMHGPPRLFGTGGPEGITLARHGQVLSSRELTHLPFLLGEMELLALEEFPTEPKSHWERPRDITIQEKQSSSGPGPGRRRGPPRAFSSGPTSTTQYTAKELSQYDVGQPSAGSVRISKKYTLNTPEGPAADVASI